MADFTPTQGRYLAFIHAYTKLHGFPPSESEMSSAMCVSPPSMNRMVKMLEKKGLILRKPGHPRSIQIIIPEEEIPSWNNRKSTNGTASSAKKPSRSPGVSKAPPVNLYVLSVWLMSGPVSKKTAGKAVGRTIEIRGDQTLEDLHETIFDAFDREEEHLYEFQFGEKPYDPKGPNYGIPESLPGQSNELDARITKLDDLELKKDRIFVYLFDFGDEWFHQVQVEKIERAIPTVKYPRITKRVGKSPPQYPDEM